MSKRTWKQLTVFTTKPHILTNIIIESGLPVHQLQVLEVIEDWPLDEHVPLDDKPEEKPACDCPCHSNPDFTPVGGPHTVRGEWCDHCIHKATPAKCEHNIMPLKNGVCMTCMKYVEPEEKPVCTACYGKGWHSQLRGEHHGEDLGSKSYDTPLKIEKNTCSRCDGSGEEPVKPEPEAQMHYSELNECEHEKDPRWNICKQDGCYATPKDRIEEIKEEAKSMVNGKEVNNYPVVFLQDVFLLIDGAFSQLDTQNQSILTMKEEKILLESRLSGEIQISKKFERLYRAALKKLEG